MIKLPRKYKLRQHNCLEEQYIDLFRAYQYAENQKKSDIAWEELESFTGLHYKKLGFGYITARMGGRV